MSQFSVSTFEQAIALYFEPIAKSHNWLLGRPRQDAYEIKSEYCIATVDFYQGQHTRSMNVVLDPSRDRSQADQVGIWAIAGFNGLEYKYIPWEQTAEGFLQESEYMAGLTKTFCLPYMLGEKSNWEQVRQYWEETCERELEKIRSYKFSPQVQKRWHLPPSESD